MKYNKIIFLLSFIIICLLLSSNTEHFNKEPLFLVKLKHKNDYRIYNLYDTTYKYNLYCDFISDFIIILNNKENKFNMMNFEMFKDKIKNFVFLNDILIKNNNATVQCEREYFYKIKYFIPMIENEYLTNGFYIFLYVLFLKYRFNFNNEQINKKLDENVLDVTIKDTTGNIFIKMRDTIFIKEVCEPEKIAGIQPDNLIKNDLQNRIDRRNPFKNVPRVIELKLINNKFKLFDIEDEFYKCYKSTYEKERMSDYINTHNFKRRLFINVTNSVNNIYMDKTLNNIYTISELEKELQNAMNNFKTRFNNNLDCNEILCNKNIEFNSSRIFTEKMFQCSNGRIIMSFKSNSDLIGNTIDINKLHYALCPSNINGKVVGKMDYFNENCSINDIEPEYIFSKHTEFTKLPFNYWLFNNKN
jgi:hypothetical protein